MSKPKDIRLVQPGAQTAFVGTIAVLLTCSAARAAFYMSPSLRGLVVDSSIIVQARPADEATADGNGIVYKVTDVLKGSDIRTGDRIIVRGLEYYRLGPPEWMGELSGSKPSPIARALLFLDWPSEAGEPNGADGKSKVLRLMGIRCLDANNNALWPRQFMRPGDLCLVPEKDANYHKIVDRVRSDVSKVDEVLALKRIEDPADRNRAIFAWIEKHRGEFTGDWSAPDSGEPNEPPGWGKLETQTCEWILDTCRVEDGWRAMKLMRDVKRDHLGGYSLLAPTFSSPAGRKLLLDVVLDPKEAMVYRTLALDKLFGSCWVRGMQREYPSAASVTPQEQAEIIRKLCPLLKDADGEVRIMAARAIADASSARDGNLRDRDTLAGLPALVEAYRDEPPSYSRNKMAEMVLGLGGENEWLKASGNPGGILVVLQSLSRQDSYGRDRICFQMNNFSRGRGIITITDQPTLVMERLDDKGKVDKRVTMPLNVTYPKDLWKKGWSNHAGCISAEAPMESLTEGRWRFHVEGRTGKEIPLDWHSEPEIIEIKEEKKGK